MSCLCLLKEFQKLVLAQLLGESFLCFLVHLCKEPFLRELRLRGRGHVCWHVC